MELVLRGEKRTEQRAVEEREEELRRPGGAPPREARGQRPAREPDQRLRGEVSGEEQRDLPRRVDRALLAETAGEQAVLAICQRQFDQ